MNFVKMQGLGNDFVIVNGPLDPEPEAIAALCDRRFGVGGDGLMAVSPNDDGSVLMQYWNADGSFSEMCGNGLRCVTRYAMDRGWLPSAGGTVVTPVGPLDVHRIAESVFRVNVGQPTLGDAFEADLSFRRVSVGNPHAVTFVDDVAAAPVAVLGSALERSTPGGTNVEFAQCGSEAISVRTWERGVGETQACGTGAVATAVAARAAGLATDSVQIDLLGGRLTVDLIGDDAYITGPAEYVFTGATELI